ncbi:uncharacterized protein IWZ02DRAFT_66078 [Phyllosticta citriasiana]|uniref:uncharacterized protein n=1 Tax=Phyllosticta citriasiana TaxID=595635 RepID=UPI0030FD35A5
MLALPPRPILIANLIRFPIRSKRPSVLPASSHLFNPTMSDSQSGGAALGARHTLLQSRRPRRKVARLQACSPHALCSLGPAASRPAIHHPWTSNSLCLADNFMTRIWPATRQRTRTSRCDFTSDQQRTYLRRNAGHLLEQDSRTTVDRGAQRVNAEVSVSLVQPEPPSFIMSLLTSPKKKKFSTSFRFGQPCFLLLFLPSGLR